MNKIKIAAISVGGVVAFAHIGLLGYVFNRPKQPEIPQVPTINVKELGLEVPVVVRLEGTNAEKGREMLSSSGLNLIAAAGLTEAAQKVVEAAK